MIFAPHMAGCSCAGFLVPLDPVAVEEDLIDFLAYRYKSEGLQALAEFVTQRNSNRSVYFGQWLETLDAAPLSGDNRNRLTADLRATLESMNAAKPAKSGYVCY